MNEALAAYHQLFDFLMEKVEVQQQQGHTDFALSSHDTLQMLKLMSIAETLSPVVGDDE